RDPARGAWCADVLLRGGAFALVVLDGAPPLSPPVATRLLRLAHDTNTALVVTGVGDAAPGSRLAGALRLRLARTRQRRRHAIAITIEKGGRRTTVEVEYVVSVARRVCPHPEVPDRRGVERPRSGRRMPNAGEPAARPVLARSRRAAEPPEFAEQLVGAGVGGAALGTGGWNAAAGRVVGGVARGRAARHDGARSAGGVCGAEGP